MSFLVYVDIGKEEQSQCGAKLEGNGQLKNVITDKYDRARW
jgi:hypothetical protein